MCDEARQQRRIEMLKKQEWCTPQDAADLLDCGYSNVRYYADKGLVAKKRENNTTQYLVKDILLLKDSFDDKENSKKTAEALLLNAEALCKLQTERDKMARRLQSEIWSDAYALGMFKHIAWMQSQCAEWLVNIVGAMTLLGDRQKDIIIRRMQGEDLQTIADDFKLSRERIRQISARAWNKLYSFDPMRWMEGISKEKESLKTKIDSLESQNLAMSRELANMRKLIQRYGISEDLMTDVKLEQVKRLMGVSVIDSGLSVRALNILLRMDIKNVAQLATIPYKEFIRERNMGRKTLVEIEDYLNTYGLVFGEFSEYETYLFNQ